MSKHVMYLVVRVEVESPVNSTDDVMEEISSNCDYDVRYEMCSDEFSGTQITGTELVGVLDHVPLGV